MVQKLSAETAALRAHTTALKRHSQALEQHARRLAAATETNKALTAALNGHGAVLALAAKADRETIRRMLGDATGNTVQGLADNTPVMDLFAGGGQIKDIIMSNINKKFWPNASKPPLTFKKIKGLNIGQLISLIQNSL